VRIFLNFYKMIQNYRESQFPMLKAARTLKWNLSTKWS